MGKKYIIELKDNTAWLQWVNVVDDGQVRFDFKYPEDLIPYTESDVPEETEAYGIGYNEGYQKGLSDAWEAARKIIFTSEEGGIEADIVEEIFNVSFYSDALKDYSASECIEKIRAYEQKKKERITKGDVVRIKSAPEVEILVTYADGGHVSGIALTEFGDSCKIGDQYTDIPIHKVEKTGEHYEIVEVLRKMKEADNVID